MYRMNPALSKRNPSLKYMMVPTEIEIPSLDVLHHIKGGDIFYPKCFQFRKVGKDFRFDSFTIKIIDDEMLKVDIELWKLIMNGEKMIEEQIHENGDKTLTYYFPFEKFIDGLFNCIGLCYTDIGVTLECTKRAYSSCHLLGYTKYYDSKTALSERRKLLEKHILNIVQLPYQKINHIGNDESCEYNITSIGRNTNGIFLQGVQPNKIQELSVKINGESFICLNRDMIKVFTRQITDDGIYIPFDTEFDYLINNKERQFDLIYRDVSLCIRAEKFNGTIGLIQHNEVIIENGNGLLRYM